MPIFRTSLKRIFFNLISMAPNGHQLKCYPLLYIRVITLVMLTLGIEQVEKRQSFMVRKLLRNKEHLEVRGVGPVGVIKDNEHPNNIIKSQEKRCASSQHMPC
jgi:hypothetical protein